jgi:hypothetical protein
MIQLKMVKLRKEPLALVKKIMHYALMLHQLDLLASTK